MCVERETVRDIEDSYTATVKFYAFVQKRPRRKEVVNISTKF